MYRLFLCLLFTTRRYWRRSTTNHKIRLLVKRKIGLNNVYFKVQIKTFCKTRLVRLLKFCFFEVSDVAHWPLVLYKSSLLCITLIIYYTKCICNWLYEIDVFVFYRSDHMVPQKIIVFVQVGKNVVVGHVFNLYIEFLLNDVF